MKNLLIKNFSLREIYNNDKTKWKDYDFAHGINCTHKHTCVCACVCTYDCMHLREQYEKPNSRNSQVKVIDKLFGNVNNEYSDAAMLQSIIEAIEKKLNKISNIHEEIESNVDEEKLNDFLESLATGWPTIKWKKNSRVFQGFFSTKFMIFPGDLSKI